MRISAVVALLVVVGFAGCIGEDTTTGTDSVMVDDDPQAKYKAAEPNTEMPEREFEGEVVLTAEVLEAAPESNLNFTMNVTDLHDYDFPLTFIDWALFYNRAPNPVAEGDATELEAKYNHTFYAEDYHLFGLRADDGQGFKQTTIVIVEIGEPERPYPNATEIQEFRNRTEEYFQEAEEEVEEVEEEIDEGAASLAELPPPIVWTGTGTYAGLCLSQSDAAMGAEASGGYLYYPKSISGVWKYNVTGTPASSFITEWWNDVDAAGNGGSTGVIPANTDNVAVCPDTTAGEPASQFRLVLYHPAWPEGVEFADDLDCRTDDSAIKTGSYYQMPGTDGSYWVYEESNGIPGAQRSDSTWGSNGNCANADTIIF